MASGSYDKRIHIWNIETGTLIRTLSVHDSVVADVAFSPDNRVLASTRYDESIKLWDWAKSKELCTLNSPSGTADTLAFAADGVTLVSGGHNGAVRTWNLTALSNQHCLKSRYLISQGNRRSANHSVDRPAIRRAIRHTSRLSYVFLTIRLSLGQRS